MKALWILLLAAMLLLAACGASPKARADEFVAFIPEEVGAWERDADDAVRLLNSTVSSKGHTILMFEGADDALAYMVVETFPGADAAEVAFTDRMRELQLRGLVFERDRAPGRATADVAQDGRARYALFRQDKFVVEVNTLAASEETLVSDESFSELLTAVRVALQRMPGA